MHSMYKHIIYIYMYILFAYCMWIYHPPFPGHPHRSGASFDLTQERKKPRNCSCSPGQKWRGNRETGWMLSNSTSRMDLPKNVCFGRPSGTTMMYPRIGGVKHCLGAMRRLGHRNPRPTRQDVKKTFNHRARGVSETMGFFGGPGKCVLSTNSRILRQVIWPMELIELIGSGGPRNLKQLCMGIPPRSSSPSLMAVIHPTYTELEGQGTPDKEYIYQGHAPLR